MTRTAMKLKGLLLACGMILATAGCSSEPAISTAPVTGRITLDGAPLPCGEIGFLPDSNKGTAGPMGTGVIGEDGRYEIRTAGQNGALVGWHKIRIVAVDKTKEDTPWIIPIAYGYPDKSGLTAEVKAGEKNTCDFDLKSSL